MRVMIVQGGSRYEGTCPGKNTKMSWVAEQLKSSAPEGVEVDILDLSVKGDGNVIQPCKGCIGTAGGYHCHWRKNGVSTDPKVRGCDCYGPASGSEGVPDVMHDEYVYYRLEQADAIMFLTPIHWYKPSTSIVAMLDRLVCASKTVPAETIIEATDGEPKNPEKTIPLEQSGVFDDQQENHLAGKVAAIFAQGDDGADDDVEGLYDHEVEILKPMKYTLRYMGIRVPDNLVYFHVMGLDEEYSWNDKQFKQNDRFLSEAQKIFRALLGELELKSD